MTVAKRRVGIYLGASDILENPGYLETLRERLGLNMVIISFCGQLSEAVLKFNPYDGQPPTDDCVRSLICRRIDGKLCSEDFSSAYRSTGPSVGRHSAADERLMRRAIDEAHRVGLEVWLLSEAWAAGDWAELMYCPSNPKVNRWYEAVYTHIATHYGVEGLDITHARYPMTSHPRAMFICGCDECAKTAAAMGYDMAQMKADIWDALKRLREADGKRLAVVCAEGMGPFDYMQLLGMKEGVIQWFKFRANVLADQFARFHTAVHAAAGEQFIFGTDTYPASLSIYAGHNHARWNEFSDFASPLLSHVDIFPMHTMIVWARFLQSLWPDVSESEALRVIYRLVGYDTLAMPINYTDYALGSDPGPAWRGEPDCEWRHVPLRDLLRLDMAKARLYLPAGIPSYPIIQGGGAPHDWPREIIAQVMADADALGHNGVIFQGTTSLVDYKLKG